MPQFGGAAEKCAVCNKTVYLAEKIVVEDKEDKKTFHKTCLKCSHCNSGLTLGNYASMQGVFYCKPHFKQLFATKGNYDEGFGKDKHTKNWTPQAVSAPASFVPVDKDEGASAGAAGKKDTPSSIASKFGKTTISSEKCHECGKTVYATEKTVIEEKEGKKVFHKTCLKCSHCNVIVTLGNYASMNGVVYCKPHFKQLFAAKGNYDEGFGKEKATSKWDPQTSTAPASFVPVDKDDGVKEKRQAPDSIAKKFQAGAASGAEKCQACGKTVYATERITVDDKEDKQTYHKTCLKCTHCSVVLTLGNYASMNGVMYCKPHFKQLFAAKGNYDEGFGKEKHTKKWADKEDQPESTSPRGQQEDTQVDNEREKQQQRDREETQRKDEADRQEREDKEREETQNRRKAEQKEQEEAKERARDEREREEREERERQEDEAAEKVRAEAERAEAESAEVEKEHAEEKEPLLEEKEPVAEEEKPLLEEAEAEEKAASDEEKVASDEEKDE